MDVSLEQALEIHGRALKHRKGAAGAVIAEEQAYRCKAKGDHEGFEVWLRVSETVVKLQRDADAAASRH